MDPRGTRNQQSIYPANIFRLSAQYAMQGHKDRMATGGSQTRSGGDHMQQTGFSPVRRQGRVGLASRGVLGALLALSLAACAAAPEAAADKVPSAIAEGQKIVMATHSFNVFIGRPLRGPGIGLLEPLAKEAGKDGHAMLAVQFIGGSTPMQHWSQGGANPQGNIAKAALLKGGADVDVFTMSPTRIVPEQGIDLFGDFIIANNPNARIMVQSSWLSFDGKAALPTGGGTGGGDFDPASRDGVTPAEIDGWLAESQKPGGYMERLRTQLAGIDARAGRQITYIVPSDVAVYNLRKAVIAGKVPDITQQTQLFSDAIGHARPALERVVTYTWFAAMYRQSPIGMTAFVDPADPASAARERLLQQIAWNAVVSEPRSGVTGAPVAIE